MRIAYCSDVVPPVADGVTRTLCELVTTLGEAKVEFLFVSAVKPDPGLAWRDRVRLVPGLRFPLYPYYRLGLPFPRTVGPVLDRFAPDLVHVVTPSFLGLAGVRYARRRGIPVVASFHTDFVTLQSFYGLGSLEWLGVRLVRGFYNQCSLTLAPSQYTLHQLRERGVHNVAVWQRGVDPERFSPAFKSEPLRAEIGARGMPILLYVGRLAREKNLHDLVEAVRVLEGRGERFKLVVVGDGPMRQKLEALLPAAHFTGYVYGEALARWYASADVFVFPCALETFGNAVLEAFASGLPVVGVDGGGVRELVTHGWNGLLAPPCAPAALADTIQWLLRRPEEAARLGLRARDTSANYRWPDVNRRLLDYYEHVLAARRYRTPLAAAVAEA